MKIGAVKRLRRTDLPGAPEWADKLLDHFNDAVETALRALQQRLTVGDNLSGFYADLDIHTLSTYTSGGWDVVRFRCPLAARAVVVAQCTLVADEYTPITDPVTVDWLLVDGQVSVRWVTGLADSSRYALRLLVLA